MKIEVSTADEFLKLDRCNVGKGILVLSVLVHYGLWGVLGVFGLVFFFFLQDCVE